MTKAIKISVFPFVAVLYQIGISVFRETLKKLIYCFKTKIKCTQTRIVLALGLWTYCSAARQISSAQWPLHMSRVTPGSKSYDIKRFACMHWLKCVFRTWSSCIFLIATWTVVWNEISHKGSFTATAFCVDRTQGHWTKSSLSSSKLNVPLCPFTGRV